MRNGYEAVSNSTVIDLSTWAGMGQALFKVASANMMQAGRPSFLLLFSSVSFYVALILYGALTILWVWLLSGVPLSRAYPFVALSFIFTPIFAIVAFNESVTITLLLC